MARKRIALSQFAVSSERDDYGVALTHSYRRCDWETWVDGMSPVELRRAARAHARVCDGQRQPRPEVVHHPMAQRIMDLWAPQIQAALTRSLVTPRDFVFGIGELEL
jgi:hypothetical protein